MNICGLLNGSMGIRAALQPKTHECDELKEENNTNELRYDMGPG